MKGCARSAFLQLAGYLATAGGVMFLLQERYGLPPSKTLGVSIFAGLFACLAWGLLVAIVEPLRERSSVRDCLAGRRPVDGTRAGFVGTIDATGDGLRSPLSGQDCVAWTYEIYQWLGQGRRRRKVTYFEGIALVPSVLSTPAGSARLLAVPTFDFAPENLEPASAARKAAEHIRTARFETSARTLEKQWTDDDGAYQSDRRHPTDSEVPLEACLFREDLIRRGEKVYAVGLFSEARGGIVPHPNWAIQTRIMKGDGESIVRQLGRRVRNYLVGSILAAAAAAALLWMFLSHANRI